MTWSKETSNGYESRKIRWEIVPYTRGLGLDLGCGSEKAFPHFIGVDNGHHEVFGYQIKPDVKCDVSSLQLFSSNSLDFVFSSHLLEHFPYDQVPSVLKEWMRVIKIGGHLVLYVPDEDSYPKVGEDGANPDHKFNVNQKCVLDAMPEGFDLIDFQKRDQEDEYSLLFVFKKTGSGRSLSYRKRERPKKSVAVVRYGAIGDLIQASSVLAGLKRQGYHVTLFCSPPQNEVILKDPNVDEFIVQDKDQVPNQMLGDYWSYWSKKFDKWINLSESVEGTLLAMPERIAHKWIPSVRHSMMGRNYLQFQHELAGVPHVPRVRFYPTEEERAWARKERARMGKVVLMWQLSGSSRMHKTYPYLDEIVARLMISYPQVHVVLTGGPECVELEAGWEKEPRVHLTSGKWSIRQTLTFLEYADVVVGAETGVMNAACCLPVPKIVFLSHSTHENLTRDWVNTVALSAPDIHCPGRGRNEAPACHMLHYDWTYCRKGEKKGVAVCMEEIDPAITWEAVQQAIIKREEQAT